MPEAPHGTLRGLAILIVEDEFLIAAEAQSVVEALGGVAVGPVGTIEAARAILAGTHLDLVVLDLGLGNQNGGTLVDDLVARGIPFVVASGFDVRTGDRLAVHNMLESIVVVRKPYGDEELAAALLHACGRSPP